MSILIKGMEMPNADFQPILIDWVTGTVTDINKTKKLGEIRLLATPHGDLIDRDAILKSHFYTLWGYTEKIAIFNAPTVIERED